MAAGGRTEVTVTSNLVYEHLSSSTTSGPNLVILALMASKRSRRRDDGDDDGDDDDDGVRGLCYKRLRQLRWARALKTDTRGQTDCSRRLAQYDADRCVSC